MAHPACKILCIRGDTVLVEASRAARAGPARFAVELDDAPAGWLEPANGAAAAELRFPLPKHRIAWNLDLRDPETGRSALGRRFDLTDHYRLAVERFGLDGAVVQGRFSVARALDDFLQVQLLHDGAPAASAYAARIGRRSGSIVYEFAAPLPGLAPLDRDYVLSARLAGAALPARFQIRVGHKQIGCVGYIERALDDAVSGWAVHPDDPGRRVALELVAGDDVIARGLADQFRDDVHALGIGDGKVGFRFAVPKQGRRGQPIGVVLAGTRTHLVNSPVTPHSAARTIGFFDGIQGRIAIGWAIDLDAPETPVEVEILRDGRVIAADTARHFRGDVEAAGASTGRCGFRIDLGAEYRASLGREVSARIRGLDPTLGGSPRKVAENMNVRRFLDRSSRLGEAGLVRLRRRLNHRAQGGALSIVMTVHDTPVQWLREALDSVRRQWCDHWELICVDDCSTEPHVRELLSAYAGAEPRIRVLGVPENVGIARATNFGIRAARFDYVTFMDHDDALEPDAVYHLIRGIKQTGADLLYSDEVLTHEDLDSIMEVRARPAFSYDYYLSHPYFVHMVCVRTSLAHRLAGWDEAMKISADVDFVLRALAASRTVAHVPAVLYRWRTHERSTGHAKQGEVMAATKAALQRHLHRSGSAAKVGDGPWFNQFRIDWPDDAGKILIVVPTRNKGALLRTCIESIERTAAGADYRLVIVDHESDEPETRSYLRRLSARHTVMPYKGAFNFARINNLAVRRHGGDASYVLFLNNDIEAIDGGWLQRMRSLAHRPEVGVVGALLLYGDRRVQHAGVIIGFNKAADHAMKFADAYIENGARRNLGYNCTLTSVRDFSAVTAACMMLRKSVFDAMGGFDETFAIGFNDTDLCLRVRDAGLKVLYDGYTMLLHHESATRSETKQVLHPEDDRRLRRRWARYFRDGDPFYNPNLDHDSTDHAVREDAACRRPAPARVTPIALGPPAADAAPPQRKRAAAARQKTDSRR
ncbi:MAG: glycosyltransferase family 2 protein [Alphaproteobacteria bacterium]|nr:glycosyltransferase family 2 protein [Alphaproteobacteria bacterium]